MLKPYPRKGQLLYAKAFSMVFVFSVPLLVLRQVVIWYIAIHALSGTILVVMEVMSNILVKKQDFAAVKHTQKKKVLSMF